VLLGVRGHGRQHLPFDGVHGGAGGSQPLAPSSGELDGQCPPSRGGVEPGDEAGEPLGPLPPLGRLFAVNASIAGFSLAALASTAPTRVTSALTQVLGHLLAGDLDIELTAVSGLGEAAAAQQARAEGRGRGKHIVELTAASAGAP